MVDVLRPIDENNRDERLLFEYDGYLTNRSEYYIRCIMDREAMVRLNPSLAGKYRPYPDSNVFLGLSGDDLFDQTARFTPKDLFTLLDPGITKEEYEKEIADNSIFHTQVFETNATRQRTTAYLFALGNLAKQKFVQQIGITCKRKLKDSELELLYELLGPDVTDGVDKLAFYCGDITAILADEHYTSIFMNDIEELYRYITTTEPELLQNRMFFIRDYYSNMEPNPQDDSILQFKHRDEIDRLSEQYKFGISSAPLTCLEEDDMEDGSFG